MAMELKKDVRTTVKEVSSITPREEEEQGSNEYIASPPLSLCLVQPFEVDKGVTYPNESVLCLPFISLQVDFSWRWLRPSDHYDLLGDSRVY